MATELATDPVCGMKVAPSLAKQTAEHQGRAYYFCAPGCKKAFESDPAKYLDPAYKPSM